MLKYYEYLLKTKQFLKQTYDFDVLENIEKFPINTDPGIRQYHEKISEVLDRYKSRPKGLVGNDRFYLHKIKPFFAGQKVYYEVTFTSTNANASKFDRVIAFTHFDISEFYATKLSLVRDRVEVAGRKMAIFVITNWEVSIRPCEINNFAKIFGIQAKSTSSHAEYRDLMRFLTENKCSLVEVIDYPETEFNGFKSTIAGSNSSSGFLQALEACRILTEKKSPGANVTRYLLLNLRNKIIKKQTNQKERNGMLSNLYLLNGCKPFDDMPFNTSPIFHNPRISDLFECIDHVDREHELFARFIQNKTEVHGQIYTHVDECGSFNNPRQLVETYNQKLWRGHSGRVITELYNHFYISEYQDNTLFALRKLKELASTGIENYTNWVDAWLDSSVHVVDCDEKRQALRFMFANSRVALIYGPAGTGKSTLINHVSHLFSKLNKLYLANTNPAIDNLKRKVDASNASFLTIAKFLAMKDGSYNYDILIIDECSTVSNRDIKDILSVAKFELLILVGDVFQIESIRFGNWFSVARSFVPKASVFELTKPYRSNKKALLEFWRRVREQEDTIIEIIAKNDYSHNLDTSIFNKRDDDEIILCLNYDGLYGINNINRLLQENNPNPAISWGVHSYKANDPILFNESNRFSPLIYNNMKGKILNIELLKDRDQIRFYVELDIVINGLEAKRYDFTLLDGGSDVEKSSICFTVNRYKTTDEDDDGFGLDIVPFQVAYAVSIHKAQGLEYKSVKIIITDETDELITHNIFYTAITRAREELKIYWSPEVEKKVLECFSTKKSSKDVSLLKKRDPSLAASS